MSFVEALPEGLKLALQKEYQVTDPFEVDSEGSLNLLLNMLVPEHVDWGADGRSRPAESLYKELRERESYISVIMFAGQQYILREIRTATLYVKAEIPAPKEGAAGFKQPVWLREFHMVNGQLTPRKYRNSMSEKLVAGETYRQAAIKALHQELGIHPCPEHLAPPHLFSMAEFPGIQEHRATELNATFLIEADIRPTPRYPGIYTRNKLEHFIWSMPMEYYRAEGYHEPDTNHYFEWTEVAKNE